MLVLVVHTLGEVTARVPFSMMRARQRPPGLLRARRWAPPGPGAPAPGASSASSRGLRGGSGASGWRRGSPGRWTRTLLNSLLTRHRPRTLAALELASVNLGAQSPRVRDLLESFRVRVLNDHVARSTLPAGLRARLILPTSGTQSISVWDAPDLMTLHSWVDENLSEYCASECFQIVEEHSYGIQMELAKARVSENVGSKASAAAASVQERAREAMSHTAAKAKEARAASQKQFSKMDEKFKMTERAQVAGGKAKEG
eukprot:gene11023-2850_t